MQILPVGKLSKIVESKIQGFYIERILYSLCYIYLKLILSKTTNNADRLQN